MGKTIFSAQIVVIEHYVSPSLFQDEWFDSSYLAHVTVSAQKQRYLILHEMGPICKQIIFICIRNKKGEINRQRYITNEKIGSVTFPECRFKPPGESGASKAQVRLLVARAYRDYFSLLSTKISKGCVSSSTFLLNSISKSKCQID